MMYERAQHQLICDRVRTRARENGGFTPGVADRQLFMFPTLALQWYIFNRMPPVRQMLEPYEPVSPSGLKMLNDDRFHSDVWLGAGLALEDCYDSDHFGNQALRAATAAVEKEFRQKIKFDFTILANGLPSHITDFTAQVYDHDPLPPNTTSTSSVFCANAPQKRLDTARAIVVPNASVQYDIPGRHAEVIITEVGGQLAHLAILARESNKLLIRIDDAVKRFPRFSKLHIDLKSMTLTPTKI